MSSEESVTGLGSKHLINKGEFVGVIIQSLRALGFVNSASCLEIESGFPGSTFELLKSQVLSGKWDDCICTLEAFSDLMDDSTRDSALFLVFKQWIFEYLSHGDYSSALAVLREQVSSSQVGRDKVHNLAFNMLSTTKELEEDVDNVVSRFRNKLLKELKSVLPPPLAFPEGRLEHLVETTVLAQVDSCLYHNSPDPVSIYTDHSCGRDQIPAETVQVWFAGNNIPCFMFEPFLLG